MSTPDETRSDPRTTVALSLISHTNVGKTTLARTLLRRDVGQILDQAHVTDVSEAHELVATDDARLLLWDTPGLGDSARLLQRLSAQDNPIGWLLHEVWDRARDRAMYSSREAVRNIQQDADVVLYLVNASESPLDAGYVQPEMRILDWIGKPVIVLLNQTGVAEPGVDAWRRALADHGVVREVLVLDAFTRCWVEEGVLLETVARRLPEDKRAAMASLVEAWQALHRATFEACVARMADYVAGAAADAESLSGRGLSRAEKSHAMAALARRLQESTRALVDALVQAHGLSGRSAEVFAARMEQFEVPGEGPVRAETGAVLGGLVSGFLGGLSADAAAGGVSFGGFSVAGAVLGALGGAGLVKGYERVRAGKHPRVRFSERFLVELVRMTMLRYLAVAHHGRGRGEWTERTPPDRWRILVDGVVSGRRERLERLVADMRASPPRSRDALHAWLREALADVLATAYPEGARGLGWRT